MSWGEPQQPPYDPNNPYGQPQPQQPSYPQQQPAQPQQPGWGQPQQLGGAPGYPQPGAPFDGQSSAYPQQGYGQPGFAPYPPPKKGNGLLVGVVVGALVVVGGGIAAAVALTGGHGGGPTPNPTHTVVAAVKLSAPGSVQDLTKLTGSSADDAVTSMRESLSGESEEYPDPVLAAYNDSDGSDVTTILVDEAMDKLSAANQAQLKSVGDASAIVDEIMSGAEVDDAKHETTSAPDGALSCGTEDEDGTSVTICVWYDVASYGTLQYVDGTSPDDAAPVADAVRAAAEQS
jgi:hypothetical protein